MNFQTYTIQQNQFTENYNCKRFFLHEQCFVEVSPYPVNWRIYIVKFWMRGPLRSNFLHIHATSGEIWPNNRLAPSLWGCYPTSGKSEPVAAVFAWLYWQDCLYVRHPSPVELSMNSLYRIDLLKQVEKGHVGTNSRVLTVVMWKQMITWTGQHTCQLVQK